MVFRFPFMPLVGLQVAIITGRHPTEEKVRRDKVAQRTRVYGRQTYSIGQIPYPGQCLAPFVYKKKGINFDPFFFNLNEA